ncbi:MAG: SDR family oxidoreductase [Phycisphaerae bacterium]|nr:SDR family oxidoreductase [Phycisphaerae bacterium]
MDKALSELISISNKLGSDPAIVQGSSGNISAKTDDAKYMYIKSTGVCLKDISESYGWRKLDIESACSIISDKSLSKLEPLKRESMVSSRLAICCVDGKDCQPLPSKEAHFHAMLDRFVIHLHPDAVGAFVSAKNGKAELEKLFKDEKLPPLWIPYADPGFMSAAKIAKFMQAYVAECGKKPFVIFLQKHGLIVSAASAKTAVQITRKVIDTCSEKLKQIKKVSFKAAKTEDVINTKRMIRKAYFDVTGKYQPVQFFLDETIASFMSAKNAKTLLSAASLSPEEIAYANTPAIWVEKITQKLLASKIKADYDKAPKPCISFLVKGVGLFVVGKDKPAQNVCDVAKSSFFIRTNAARMGGLDSLNRCQIESANLCESISAPKAITNILQDRIAVVTGAGSGIGRSIAIGLARAGAMVVLADIDTNAAEETASFLSKELPDSSTFVVGCNVTSESDVDKAYQSLLQRWGGLDILVNAAGVAPAFPLVDFPVDKWRFALEVNLTGYFLMARGAARIMTNQQIGGSIINISSKSGIEPSKNNTPYNATKAGELHMARGWAMELGPQNIRVNSVCPGNVFEGSKIWNPEYIKVCAKKYGIKPEEVIPYYISKTMLNREIKGQDIADSVVFLCSDQARRITAQTIVTDSGQAIVR